MNTEKIGIVTLHGYNNYGNNLQNYALKKVIEKLGYGVDTTVIEDKSLDNHFRMLRNNPKKFLLNVKRELTPANTNVKKEHKEVIKNREEIFREFSNQYLSEKFYKLNKDKAELSKYAYFVTGSDQVWNPQYYRMLSVYFLTFVLPEKRISYAASISRDKLPQNYQKEYTKWLEDMSAISVREDAGAKIVKDLTGDDVPVLVDPTMLLNKEEWLSISKRASNRPDKPYILTYFLGGPTDETREKLDEIAKEKNMTVINLGDISDKETYKTGPSEFLDYINNASAFFTDSFHGVVYSIIFETPFIIYERLSSNASMYSRIETILDNFNLRNREAKNFKEDIFSMDFSGSDKVLDREYEKSIRYLKKALRIEE